MNYLLDKISETVRNNPERTAYISSGNEKTVTYRELDENSAKNNINKGNATIELAGTGKFGGTKTVTVKINAKTVNSTNVLTKASDSLISRFLAALNL